MADTPFDPEDPAALADLNEQREKIRAVRQERRDALATFVTTLGFAPDKVRSLTVVDGSIRLTLFVHDDEGKPVKAPLAGGSAPVLHEVNLLTTNTDLDQDEFMHRLVGGHPIL